MGGIERWGVGVSEQGKLENKYEGSKRASAVGKHMIVKEDGGERTGERVVRRRSG